MSLRNGMISNSTLLSLPSIVFDRTTNGQRANG